MCFFCAYFISGETLADIDLLKHLRLLSSNTCYRCHHNKEFAIFQNSGYMGLYGGLDVEDIHDIKGLTARKKILDYMGSTELITNLFRI